MAYVREYAAGQDFHHFKTGVERRVTPEGVPYFVDLADETSEWLDPRAYAMNMTKVFEPIRRTAYRVAYHMRFIQRELSLDKISLKAITDAFNANHVSEDADKLMTSDEMLKVLEHMYADVVGNAESSATLALGWLLSVYDRKHCGKLTMHDFKIALTALSASGRGLRRVFEEHFNIVDSNHDSMVSAAEIERYVGTLCKMVYTIGEGASMCVSMDNIKASVDRLFPTAMRVTRVQEFVGFCLSDERHLMWLPLMSRLTASEEIRHDGACFVCKLDLRGLLVKARKFGRGKLCERCYIEGREAGRFRNGQPVREYVLEPSILERSSDFFASVRNTGKKTRQNRLTTEPNYRDDFGEHLAKEKARSRSVRDHVRKQQEDQLRAQALEVERQKLAVQQQELLVQQQEAEAQLATANQRGGVSAGGADRDRAAPPPPMPVVRSSSSSSQDAEQAHTKVLTVYDQETHALIAQFAARVGQLESGHGSSAQLTKNAPSYRRPVSSTSAMETTSASESETDGPGAQRSVVITTQTSDDEFGPVITEEMLVAGQAVAAGVSAVSDADDEFAAEGDLVSASAEMESVVAQMALFGDDSDSDTGDEMRRPSFGEQLLQAARNVANTTSALVLQAAAVKKAEASEQGGNPDEVREWTQTVNDKAAGMHEAARKLCQVMTRDQMGQASEDEVVRGAEEVKAASTALLDACAANDEMHPSPLPFATTAVEARRTAVESKEHLDDLVDFATRATSMSSAPRMSTDHETTSDEGGAAAAAVRAHQKKQKSGRRVGFGATSTYSYGGGMTTTTDDDDETTETDARVTTTGPSSDSETELASSWRQYSMDPHHSSGGEESPSPAPVRLKPIYDGPNFGRKITMKRLSLQTQNLAERWLYILFAIEEEAGVEIPGVNDQNVATELPKKLRDGTVVCKLVNAFLRRRSNTDAIVPHMPEEGARLATIRVMENMEFFRDGCRRLGLSDGDLCNTFDLVEGKGGIETVRCLEAIVHFGRSIPQSE